MHYLMLKTHTISGMKYLCKTSRRDPYTYAGSGKVWKKHLKKYGFYFNTVILAECLTTEELKQKGIYYSELWDVVNNCEFANLVQERGDGGPTMLGRKITPAQSKKKSIALLKFNASASKEYKEWRRKLNSESHEKYRYYTPAGIFTNSFVAAKANDCSNVTIINRCLKDVDKPILSKKYWKYGWKGKTWRELGWWSDILNA